MNPVLPDFLPVTPRTIIFAVVIFFSVWVISLIVYRKNLYWISIYKSFCYGFGFSIMAIVCAQLKLHFIYGIEYQGYVYPLTNFMLFAVVIFGSALIAIIECFEDKTLTPK